jgi:hypothetical protein
MSATVTAIPREPIARHSVDEWAEVIRADFGRSVESIIATGRHLVEARIDVDHGEWLPLLERIGIGERTAQRFMFIADNLRLANPTRVSHLPAAWGTLYELAKLPPDVLEKRIADGTITPESTRKEIALLKGRLERPTKVNGKPPPDPFAVDDKQVVRFEISVSVASIREIDLCIARRPGVSREQMMEQAVEKLCSDLRARRLKREARDQELEQQARNWERRQKYERAMAEKRARGA